MAPGMYAKDQPQGFTNRVQKVAIVGSGGQIGKPMTEHLLATGKHTVTALTRPGSTSVLPAGVKAVAVDYDSQDSLVAALKGQDFLIITLSVAAPPGTHSKLLRAAAAAGLTYVMPNAYGIDTLNQQLAEDISIQPIYRRMIEEARELGLRAVTITCGFWYEFSLGGGEERFGFDFKNRELTLFDDGTTEINTSTWAQCGRAAAALLSLPMMPADENDTRPTLETFVGSSCYISSFLVSQRAMFESVKRVTETTDADWKIKTEDSLARWKAARERLAKGDSSAYVVQLYTRTFFPGGGGNVQDKLSNDVLGLPQEDLDEWTRVAVERGLQYAPQGRAGRRHVAGLSTDS